MNEELEGVIYNLKSELMELDLKFKTLIRRYRKLEEKYYRLLDKEGLNDNKRC